MESILCSTVPINVVQIKASGKSGSKFKLTAKCVFGGMEPVIPAENATFTIQLDRPTTKFSVIILSVNEKLPLLKFR